MRERAILEERRGDTMSRGREETERERKIVCGCVNLVEGQTIDSPWHALIS